MPFINPHHISTPYYQQLETPLENESVSHEASEGELRLRSRQRQLLPLLASSQRAAQQFTQALLAHAKAPTGESAEAVQDARLAQAHANAELQQGLQRLVVDLQLEVPEFSFGDAEQIMSNPHDKDASGLLWGSASDFYKQISALLGAMQSEWLARYQEAVGKFVEFYAALSAIMEKLVMENANDKGDVTFDLTAVLQELDALIAKYELPENSLATFESKADADAFVASLGMPGLTVKETGSSPKQYAVMMDLDPARQLATTPKGRQTWNSARYASWQDSKNLSMERLNQASKMLQEKLSEATQKYNRAVEILSATIDKNGGVDRLVADNIGR